MERFSISSCPDHVRRTLYYFLVGIVPLYVGVRHLFPYTVPKTLLIIGSAVIVLLVGVWEIWRDSRVRISIGWGSGALLLLCINTIVSGLSGVDPSVSFFGTLVDGMGINILIALLVISYGMSSMIRKDGGFLRRLLIVASTSGVLVATGTYFPQTFKEAMGGSTLGNGSYAGGYLLLVVCFTFYLWMTEQRSKMKVLYGVSTVFILGSPLFINWNALTRVSFDMSSILSLVGSANGAVLGLVCAALIGGSLSMTLSSKRIVAYGGVVIFVLVLGGLYSASKMVANPHTSLHRTFVSQKSANRFLFVDIARQGFVERPFLGWGQNNYATVFREKFSPQFYEKKYMYEPATNSSHNVLWDYLVSGGVVGLVSYSTVLAVILIVLYKRARNDSSHRKLSLILMGAFAGYVIQALFIFDTPAPLLLWFTCIAIALSSEKKVYRDFAFSHRGLRDTLGGCVVVTLLILFIITVIAPWRESVAWGSFGTATTILRRTSYPQTTSQIGSAENGAFVVSRIVDVVNQSVGSFSPAQTRYTARAIEKVSTWLEDETASSDDPAYFRVYWVSGQLNLLRSTIESPGSIDQSLLGASQKDLSTALAINSAHQDLYFLLSKSYIVQSNYSRALTYIRAAIALAPRYAPGYDQADALLDQMPPGTNREYIDEMKQRWISAYE